MNLYDPRPCDGVAVEFICTRWRHIVAAVGIAYYAPYRVWGIKRWWASDVCLSDVCLSVCCVHRSKVNLQGAGAYCGGLPRTAYHRC